VLEEIVMEFNTRDWTRNLPSTDEVLRAIGLQTRRSSAADIMPSVALFGAGMLVGAVLALLLAPTSGEELRGEISERASHLGQRSGTADETTRPYRSTY
jgi:hypothetical protein